MSEALDRIRDVKELPVFPLPVVLFPGIPLPLHIFEPRYRQMLDDVKEGNKFFGLSYLDTSESSFEVPPTGHIGCAAEITEVMQLPDGRSNILTLGLIRYRIESYVERGDPYLVARVSFFEDEPAGDPVALSELTEEVSTLFLRIAAAIRTISEENASTPELPETEPERLSYLVAAAIDIEAKEKQQLLELKSTTERLSRLKTLLDRAVSGYEERARMHVLARKNGHAGKEVDIE